MKKTLSALGLVVLGSLFLSLPVMAVSPSQMKIADVSFERVGCGMRALMWKDIYVLSLYAGPGESNDSASLLRMDVVYDGKMPDGVPADWLPSLTKVVSQETIDGIDGAFTKLVKGDAVEFAYLPTTDQSTVFVNSDVKVQIDGQDLYDTIQGMWLGDKPISKSLKKNILGRVCDV